MGLSLRHVLVFVIIGPLWNLKGSEGIGFVIDRGRCFSHDVKYDCDTVHVSFIVIKADSPWHYGNEGVDLVVKVPSGDRSQDFRDKTSEKFDFVAHKSGVHKFCFTNKSPYHETIDFDVHVGHFSYFEQHAKDGNASSIKITIFLGLSMRHVLVFVIIGAFWNLKGSEGIKFVIDRDECFSHDVKYEGDTVHVSFVVIKADSPWHYNNEGVDLVVKGHSGDQIKGFRDKTSEKFDFVAHKSGVHKFCFTNKSPYHETIDFDVHVSRFSYFEQHAKDEHCNPLLEQIAKF